MLESTGHFRKREQAALHLEAGAGAVVISAPATDPDVTLVLGVNDETTEGRAPDHLQRLVHDELPGADGQGAQRGVRDREGLMTTCHAYTNDQRVADQIHTDPYRARAAAINIIPSTTGAAKAVGEVIPELNGKLDRLRLAGAGSRRIDHRPHVAARSAT